MTAGLFTIETNVGFECVPVPIDGALRRAAEAFRIESHAAGLVRKHNTGSTLYWMRASRGDAMLRRVAAREAFRAEHQCQAAAAVGGGPLVRPMATSHGAYAWADDGHAWTAYPRIDGTVFTGFDCDVEIVLGAALSLQAALRALARSGRAAPWSSLARVEHRPDEWERALACLRDPSGQLPVSDQTRSLVADNSALVGDCLAAARALVPSPPTLTHNDLQHANVLIERGRPRFVDLEDLAFESGEIAVAHAVFKLVRHAVFTGALALDEARRDTVPAILAFLGRDGWPLGDRGAFLACGAYRIISDIAEILRLGGEHLYDLEKRVHNLFELCELLDRGPAAS